MKTCLFTFFCCREGKEPPNTCLEDVIYAKKLYESSFHPDSGEKQNVFGRMSFQVPGGMIITGAMLQFYRFDFYVNAHNLMFALFNNIILFFLFGRVRSSFF